MRIRYAIGRTITVNGKKRWIFRTRLMTIHKIPFDTQEFFRQVIKIQKRRYSGWQLEGYAEMDNQNWDGFEWQMCGRAGK